ncbi:stage II sporulation protein D [Aliibacillus thermotolerans]|nr:stage II sporulation protein D [Aliibacillus thermotolerans]
MIVFFSIPVFLVLLFQEEHQQNTSETKDREATEIIRSDEPMVISVFRTEMEKVEEVELEDYVVGVVASEMPAEFEIEALKAQALTARTYAVKQFTEPTDIDLPEGAFVTDSETHQVYHSEEELKELWGEDYQWKINRVKEAVEATKGQVLTYEGELITAAFFSTSNGYTENAEDYWENPVPYLQSVESPWDTDSPRYHNSKKIPIATVEERLGTKIASTSVGEIISRTNSGRVKEVTIGNDTFTGREVREKLKLDSSDFEMERAGNDIIFHTKGWGHGVGMSQYGALGMAEEGKQYTDIVKHYFKGVEIVTL